jgi:hypothetical protein
LKHLGIRHTKEQSYKLQKKQGRGNSQQNTPQHQTTKPSSTYNKQKKETPQNHPCTPETIKHTGKQNLSASNNTAVDAAIRTTNKVQY